MRVEFSEGFLKRLRALSVAERKAVGEAVNAAVGAWGKPHLHAGVGIRRLYGPFFECRSGLKSRLIFEWADGALFFHFEGNHDAVRRFLRDLK